MNLNAKILKASLGLCGAIIVGTIIYDQHSTRIHNQRMQNIENWRKKMEDDKVRYESLIDGFDRQIEAAKFWTIVLDIDD